MLACDLSQESNEIRFSGLHRHFRKNDPTDNIYYIKSPKKKGFERRYWFEKYDKQVIWE